jgi:23S rRNA pseudouridine1911/1915/1917 synthase
VPKPSYIELPDETRIPILYEDRSVLALDKPAGWFMGPDDWEQTGRNLPPALQSSLNAGDYWARSRNLRFLRYVHRLDAGTSGILLFAKSPGAMEPYSRLFADRVVKKTYLAVTDGIPRVAEWTRKDKLGPDEREPGRHRIDPENGKPAQTDFRVLQAGRHTALVEAKPYTGRTHQIRLHLAAGNCPVQGDDMYGTPHPQGLALRAVGLEYIDPFTRRPVRINAPAGDFCRSHGFKPPERPPQPPNDRPSSAKAGPKPAAPQKVSAETSAKPGPKPPTVE